MPITYTKRCSYTCKFCNHLPCVCWNNCISICRDLKLFNQITVQFLYNSLKQYGGLKPKKWKHDFHHERRYFIYLGFTFKLFFPIRVYCDFLLSNPICSRIKCCYLFVKKFNVIWGYLFGCKTCSIMHNHKRV